MPKTFSSLKKWGLVLGLVLCIPAVSAMAQAKYGVRMGATLDPDQFHIGGHIISDPLVQNLSFRPNLEFGIGDKMFTTAFNLEFAYSIPVPNNEFAFYVGAGPALNIYRYSNDHPQHGGNTDATGGFNILLGIEHENGLMGEFKVGTIDSPDVKFTIGYTF